MTILSIYVLASPISTYAQQHYAGISGGAGLTFELGIRAAAVSEIPLTSFLSIEAQIAFSQRPNRELVWRLNPDIDYRQAMIEYIEVPVLAKFNVNVNSFSVAAYIGPNISYGLKVRASSLQPEFTTEKIPFEELNLSRFDMGLNLGVGLDKTISKNRKIFLVYLFYLGLKDIDQNQFSEMYNQGAFVNLGFLIPLSENK